MKYLLQHCVDEVAAKSPDRIAFCTPDSQLTYAALARVTNQLSQLLARHGVTRGDRVGIYMPRCLESAIAVYGTLKAGAVFVPVDPALPVASLIKLLEDCQIGVLLTHRAQRRQLQSAVDAGAPLKLVCGLDEPLAGVASLPWSALEQLPPESRPEDGLTEDDLAYLMYSSGSTGAPKGIMHTHRSGLAYARLSTRLYGLGAGDRVANHSPLHFDMSTLGYLSAMYAGATTVIIPEAHTRMVASLAGLMEQLKVTVWYSVPLALIQLLERGALEDRDLSPLRWVLFGGEPFPVRQLLALMKLWPQARFSNVYGPAEVNQCTYYHIPRDATGAPAIAEDAPVPLGMVWPNTECLIVDAHDEPVAADTPGELLVRSPTMMRGYWARPDLNARAFFRRRTASDFEQVFFRTGDRVRVNGRGLLEYLGRMDRQVKVRGYRVDLDDVEHALGLLPDVLEAAAYPVVRDGTVAHIEASVRVGARIAPDEAALRRAVAKQLSPYAVPAYIQVAAELPRTTSGKIDRRALQADAEERMRAEA